MNRVSFLKAALTLPAPYSSDTISQGNADSFQSYRLELLGPHEGANKTAFDVIHVIPVQRHSAKEIFIPASLCVFQLVPEEVKEEVQDIPIVQLPAGLYKPELN